MSVIPAAPKCMSSHQFIHTSIRNKIASTLIYTWRAFGQPALYEQTPSHASTSLLLVMLLLATLLLLLPLATSASRSPRPWLAPGNATLDPASGPPSQYVGPIRWHSKPHINRTKYGLPELSKPASVPQSTLSNVSGVAANATTTPRHFPGHRVRGRPHPQVNATRAYPIPTPIGGLLMDGPGFGSYYNHKPSIKKQPLQSHSQG